MKQNNKAEKQTLIARRNAQDSVEIGTNLLVSFPRGKIIFIDPLSEKIFHDK